MTAEFAGEDSLEPFRWQRRFRYPRLDLPRWSRDRPTRLVYSSSRRGSWQGWTVDLEEGVHRQLTHGPVGNRSADISPDGRSVIWFEDKSGDEMGKWQVEPFPSGGARDLLPGAPSSWESGLAWGQRLVLAGLADESGFTILTTIAGSDCQPTRLYHHRQEAFALAISRDDRYALIACAEHGDSIHPDLRVLDTHDGSLVGQLRANGRRHLQAAGFNPSSADPCVAVSDDSRGHLRPGLWWPRRGDWRPLASGLHGELEVMDWFPDGESLLLRQLVDGRHRLWRLRIPAMETTRIAIPRGTATATAVRPDERIWVLTQSAARPPRVIEAGSQREVFRVPGRRPPRSVPLSNWRYETADRARVHGFLAVPPGNGPFPTVIWVHGGPHWHLDDAFMPSMAALVDHGLLVAAPNYRGSTGYGRIHMDRLTGDPGFPEVADVARGVADLVARGLTDPRRVVLMGASWGGYITLLGLGLHPELFTAGVARVPVADYELAFAEESEPLQAMDRALFGGDPSALPNLYRERSPITYAERVTAPLLIQAGENDSRCPYHQIEVYVRRLEELGKRVTFHHYPAGHSAMVVEQDIALTAQALEFLTPLLKLSPAS